MTYAIITPKAVQKQLDACLMTFTIALLLESNSSPKTHALMEWSR